MKTVLGLLLLSLSAFAGKPSAEPSATVVLECGENAPMIVTIGIERFVETTDGRLEPLQMVGDTIESSTSYYLNSEGVTGVLYSISDSSRSFECNRPRP